MGIRAPSPPQLRKASAVAAVAAAVATTTCTATTTTTGSAARRGAGLPTFLWENYTRSLARSPLLTKATMASFIFFTSDSVTQYLMHSNNNHHDVDDDDFSWDASRALSGASFGIVATSWLHYWWGFLEHVVAPRLPFRRSSKFANTIAKVLIDQGIGAPLYIYSYYVITNFAQQLQAITTAKDHTPDLAQAAEGPSSSSLSCISSSVRISQAMQALRNVHSKAAEMIWPTMRQHYTIWPFVHTLNFYYIPLHHRVLVQNTVLVGWSGYLSHLNHCYDQKQVLMTPDQEVKVAAEIVRRRTTARLPQKLKSTLQQVPTAEVART